MRIGNVRFRGEYWIVSGEYYLSSVVRMALIAPARIARVAAR